jgi:hypothetical protein
MITKHCGMLTDVCDDKTFCACVFVWHKRFLDVREDMHDDLKPGQLKTTHVR